VDLRGHRLLVIMLVACLVRRPQYALSPVPADDVAPLGGIESTVAPDAV